jgi:hypothetical protein
VLLSTRLQVRQIFPGVIAFDYDADKDLDLYFTRIEEPNLLFRNNGNFQFTDVTLTAGVGDNLPDFAAFQIDLGR